MFIIHQSYSMFKSLLEKIRKYADNLDAVQKLIQRYYDAAVQKFYSRIRKEKGGMFCFHLSNGECVAGRIRRNGHGKKRTVSLGEGAEITINLNCIRCDELHVDLLTIGLVMDIWTEKGNDSTDYARVASQEDFDSF